MEDTIYWIIEYCKVLAAYGFLMFVWPMVMFRKYLKGKSVTFRFSFCVTVQMVLINTVVLMLGLLHILNDWTLRILFYGTFLYSTRELYRLTPERKRKFKYLVNGTFGWKNFLFLQRRKCVRIIEKFCKCIGKIYKKHWLEYSLLLIALVYGAIYFSWGTFQENSYGFSDMYVHHSWIYQLSEGNVFSSGIYPEGMHCIIYALNALFNISIYNSLLFSGLVNVVLVLVAAYCLMKELFQWRYSAVAVLIGVLMFGGVHSPVVTGLSRLQCALPQEFGFSAIFICCLYLVRYLKSEKHGVWKGKETKCCWNSDLLIFILALTATIAIHFYATFMAFFLCVGIALVLWRNIFTKRRFLPLVAAVIIGVFVAVLPMATGVLIGRPLEGSLYWAMSVIRGDDEAEVEQIVIPDNVGGADNFEVEVVPEQSVTPENGTMQEVLVQETSFVEKLVNKIVGTSKVVREKLINFCNIIYHRGIHELFHKQLARMIPILGGITIAASILYVSGAVVLEKVCGRKMVKYPVSGYGIIVAAALVYMIFFLADYLGLPMLVDNSRMGFIIYLFLFMIVVMPFDFIFSLAKKIFPLKVLNLVSCVAIGIAMFFIYVSGNYHGYLYFLITRYPSTAQVTEKIVRELPEKSYTIVSPTEELYQVIESGWHEELITFLDNQSEDEYYIPTEYVFLFVEKRPLEYAQLHTFDGPEWLAGSKYTEEVYKNVLEGIFSEGTEYIASEVSEMAAAKELLRFNRMSDMYSFLRSRVIIESKALEWCKRYKVMYPNEMKIYYEDESVICYYYRQNTQKLYNLSLE